METTIEPINSFVNEGYDLQYLLREPATRPTTQKAIILLHGVGSNEQDLFSLKLHLPNDYIFICPRGPYVMGAGIFAWYEVDYSTGKLIKNLEEEENSRRKLINFIAQVKAAYQLDEIYLGGFSQGAIMSYSIGLTHPELVKGLIILSSRILAEIRPSVKKSLELEKLRVFIAHGTLDATMSVSCAREAKEFLENLGIHPSYHEYVMGHQINKGVLKDLIAWLKVSE
jgi:phospholipase/carboxylesterase